MKTILIPLLFFSIYSCSNSSDQDLIEKYKSEILETEKAFATMAKQKSIPEAFIYFADENAALLREDSLIVGKTGIAEYYEAQDLEGVDLSWTVDFVDVSSSGDFGYTYGKYYFSMMPDTAGEIIQLSGIFHTVWKKQADNSWKFVWD